MNEFLQKVLPFLGAAATGNVPLLVSMAASEIGTAIGLPVKADGESISKAVMGATPEQMVALQAAEQGFKERMRALGIQEATDLARIAAGDRADARNREIKTGDSWTPRIIGGLVVVGYVGVQWYLLTGIVAVEMRDLVMRSLGVLDTALGLVLSYYFGSSAGSRAKDDTIASMNSAP